MRVFVDTDVLLDVLARRNPFYAPAAEIWTRAETGELDAWVSAISFNDCYHILRRLAGMGKARLGVRLIRDIFEVVPLDARIIGQALDSGIGDFEDAILFHSAARIRARYLVTRDPGDFRRGTLAVLTPQEHLAAPGASAGRPARRRARR